MDAPYCITLAGFAEEEATVRPMIDSFLAYLPQLFAAVVVLIIGIVIAVVVRVVVAFLLRRLQFDALCQRAGLTRLLEHGNIKRRPSQLVGTIIYYGFLLYTILTVLGMLGLTFLASSLNLFLLSAPRILTALALLVLGIAGAGLAAEAGERVLADLGVERIKGLRQVMRFTLIFLVIVLVSAMLGIDVQLLITITAIVLSGIVLTAALAIGLGLRGLSENIAAGRYIADGVREGDRISLNGITGTVEQIGYAMTTVRGDDERVFLIPNHQFTAHVIEKAPPSETGSIAAPDATPER